MAQALITLCSISGILAAGPAAAVLFPKFHAVLLLLYVSTHTRYIAALSYPYTTQDA